MIKVKDLAVELSIKIGDPRADNGDGTLFFREDRLKYLTRGYGKLIRTLSMAMRKYRPSFVLPLIPFHLNIKTTVEGGTERPKSPYQFERPFISLDEVIVSRQTGQQPRKIFATSRLDPQNYNKVKFGLDPLNVASAEEGKENIFYTPMNGQLYLLPDDGQYVAIDAMGVEDITELKESDELPIEKLYVDMLITFAAIEAMNDLPNPQKVQLYRGELIDHVSVVSSYTNLLERNEGAKDNG